MLSREGKQTDRGAVGAEFIGYDRRRREALLLQEFPHQPNCRPSVPAGLNQEIQDFALTVHGTPEIELPPSNYDDHLVQVPAFGRSWPPTLNPPRIGPTEFQDPSSNCLIREVETTLGKQVLNVPIAQRETAIEPDGMLDDDRWKAVTTVGYLAHPETLKHRPCRSHAVNVTMPLELMDEWRIGQFDADWPGLEPMPPTFDHIPTADQPAALDKAALDACIGDPFFPGIEAGFMMATSDTYRAPFRIDHHNYGAGSITSGLACPWQADFEACKTLWWPAQRPNWVIRNARRTLWTPTSWTAADMVTDWYKLGFVLADGNKFVEKERRV